MRIPDLARSPRGRLKPNAARAWRTGSSSRSNRSFLHACSAIAASFCLKAAENEFHPSRNHGAQILNLRFGRNWIAVSLGGEGWIYAVVSFFEFNLVQHVCVCVFFLFLRGQTL